MHFLGRITYKQIYEETDLESHIRSNDNLGTSQEKFLENNYHVSTII